MKTARTLTESLERRRKGLRMPRNVLAKRANLGQATVERALSGRTSVRVDTLMALAHGLGMRIDVGVCEPRTAMLEEQAKQKARRLAGMTQASAGLEGQAASDEVRKDVEWQLTIDLLAGSQRRLWAT